MHASKTPLEELAGDELGVRFQPRHYSIAQKLGLNLDIPTTAWIAKPAPGTALIEAVLWAIFHVQQKMPNDPVMLAKPITVGIFRDTHQSMHHFHKTSTPACLRRTGATHFSTPLFSNVSAW